tara:strand:- start:125 stop:268 length:144 start_codon:yes stop_codon:yes gene_type:complete
MLASRALEAIEPATLCQVLAARLFRIEPVAELADVAWETSMGLNVVL